MKATIHIGNCLQVLKNFAENSVDAIVTDPPYELGFMGKAWDNSGIANDVTMWAECLRVLKPGGYLLSFGGSRTYHRMACAIEDAGFEIRDQIMWIYGSGFPKSLDVSKVIDKAARGVPQGGADPTSVNHGKFKGGCSEDNPNGRGFGAGPGQFMAEGGEKIARELVAEAQQWQGWGTALKPAHETICVARKPIEGTVAANVLAWGTGALNINGCRIGTGEDKTNGGCAGTSALHDGGITNCNPVDFSVGRWPANVILDGSEEVTKLFPESEGQQGDVRGDEPSGVTNGIFGEYSGRVAAPARNDEGSAARFFYQVRGDEPSAERTYEDCGVTNFAMKPGARRIDDGSAARFFYTAKADRSERNAGLEGMPEAPCGMMEDDNYPILTGHGKPRNTTRQNNHPTVKPVDLMAYLCRLVTPPGGVILDPFTGSGSTGIAALKEGFEFIGIEISPEYAAIAEKRIKGDNPLFTEVEVIA